MRAFFLCLALLTNQVAYTQYTNRTDYDIKRSATKDELAKKCKSTLAFLRSMPPDIRFSTQVHGDSVFLTHNDQGWFQEFFNEKNDGFAIDLIHQDQYKCDNVQRLSSSWSHKGFLLPPTYRDQIRKNTRISKSGNVYVYAGPIPRSFNKNAVEANYILLEDRYLCRYTTVISLDFHGWDILKMGLYYDTMKSEAIADRYKDLSKTLRFTIPFEKNLAEYKKEDIKPLYDSLKITDYAITSITIKAFTSVEGTTQRNSDLQNQRAQSIVSGLQSFQTESIQSNVITNENWVEFLEDIQGTSYQYLMTQSKEEIKEALRNAKLSDRLEPVLRKHRKAIIELQLEKRIPYAKATGKELKKYFDQSIAEKNIEEALYLQEIIFHKIEREEIPLALSEELEVPRAREFGSLLINKSAFSHEHDNQNVFEALKTFSSLKELLKENAKVDFNLCVLSLKSWLQTEIIADPPALKKSIESLRTRGIPETLVKRLLINYHIILSEISHKNKKYAEKDAALKFINTTYQKTNLQDQDLVNLSKYFSFFSKFDWAETILHPRIKALDASEDLLFYYISLTVFEPKNTSSSGYRSFLLNAVNSNRKRFCELFESIPNGGVTFQLLEDPFLKKTFCENCE